MMSWLFKIEAEKKFGLLILTSFLCCFPLFVGAFQNVVKLDSVKLERSLTVLKNISASSVDSIISYSDQKIQYYTDINQPVAVRRVAQTAGFVLSKYGYLGLSEKYYLEAVSLARSSKDKIAEADITNSIGVLWGKRGDFVKAEAFFLKALLISEKAGYPIGINSSYLKLSTLRIRQNRIDDAFAYCLKIDSVNKKYDSHLIELDVLNNKAIVYAIRGDLDKALQLFNEGYTVSVNSNELTNQVSSLQNIGLVYKEKGDFDTALLYLNKGLELANRSGLIAEGLRVSVNIPNILIQKKEYQLALDKLKGLLVEANKLGLDDLVLEIYQGLIDIAKLQGNYKEAFGYFEEFTRVKDKQNNEQKQRALQEAYVSLGLYKANAEILEKNNLLFQKNRERNIIFAILIFVGILTAFLVFILLRLKKLNGRLNKQRRLLTESNQIKDKLFSIIGHDLRGHQGTTLGILTLIRDGELDDAETQLYLNMIIKQSQSALTTLDDLLLWGKAQIKGDKHQQSDVEVFSYIQAAIDLNSEAIHEKRLNVTLAGLKDAKVFTDSNHFSFVIRNLIANAVKFTPNEGLIKVSSEMYQKNLLKVCVTDNGVGMSSEELKSIFSPESVSKRGTNNEAGTGLGLILCKEFVEANGGEIWAEQNVDGGTTVCFTCLREKSGR